MTPWTTACQALLSITNSQSLLKLMSIELVMPSNHLIFCRPLLPPPSIFLGLIWKFNCKCVYTGKYIVYTELSTICNFRHLLGGLRIYPTQIKGDYCVAYICSVHSSLLFLCISCSAWPGAAFLAVPSFLISLFVPCFILGKHPGELTLDLSET